jgi:preprotein translocase subunit SecA
MSGIIQETVQSGVSRFAGGGKYPEEWDLDGLVQFSERVFLPPGVVQAEAMKQMEGEEIQELLLSKAMETYKGKEAALGAEAMRELERVSTLWAVDAKWTDHLDAMDQLRQGIGLRAYGQRDPLIEYKHEAFDMFSEMIAEIQEEIVRYVFHMTIVERPKERTNLMENHQEAGNGKPAPAKSAKIGRNDPCPCGSGRKYKMCHGATPELAKQLEAELKSGKVKSKAV